MTRKPSVLLGLEEIAGFYENLRDGLVRRGYRTTFCRLKRHRFGYGYRNRNVLVWIITLLGERLAVTRSVSLRWLLVKADIACRAALLLYLLPRYDVFVFGFCTSFCRFRELPLLKLLGKRIIYIFHGSDARPACMDGLFMVGTPARDADTVLVRMEWQTAAVRAIEKYADLVISAPNYGQYFSKPFVSFYALGFPVRASTGRTPETKPRKRPVILHAPSHRAFKGTDVIRRMVDRLSARGLGFEYRELTGLQHDDVLGEIAACDFVIDQVYSDTPMATFAAEAAHFGKPAVVCGYFSEELARFVDPGNVPPGVFVHPDELEAAVTEFIIDPARRELIGEACRRFVNTVWSTGSFFDRFEMLLDGRIPEDWMTDPNTVSYHLGAGVSQEYLERLYAYLITERGWNPARYFRSKELSKNIAASARVEIGL